MRIIEFTGRRRPETPADDVVTEKPVYIFGLDDGTVIDPCRGGNEARFINHSCQPNCETIDEDGRIFVEAIRNIRSGEELFFDYRLEVMHPITSRDLRAYRCLCGSAACRGTMLWLPRKRIRPPRRSRPAAAR